MSLLSYEAARPWARAIKTKVLAGEMPPEDREILDAIAPEQGPIFGPTCWPKEFKEAAKTACRQLKHSDIVCIAIKK
jgi:hypothetical protein